MSTYIVITDPETDPEAPLTSELAKKWRDNPLAIAEGDTTAPVNAGNWHPYNKITNGDSNAGRFYSFAVNGAVSTRVPPDFEDGWEYRIRAYNLSINAGSVPLTIELFRETTGAYSAAYSMFTIANTSDIDFELYLPWVRYSKQDQLISFVRTSNNGTNVWLAPGDDTKQVLAMSTEQKITRVRLSVGGSTFDAGTMWLDRRRLVV